MARKGESKRFVRKSFVLRLPGFICTCDEEVTVRFDAITHWFVVIAATNGVVEEIRLLEVGDIAGSKAGPKTSVRIVMSSVVGAKSGLVQLPGAQGAH